MQIIVLMIWKRKGKKERVKVNKMMEVLMEYVKPELLALAFVLYFHLSSVLALFIMLPFSKFIHLFYRFIALLKYNIDEQEH